MLQDLAAALEVYSAFRRKMRLLTLNLADIIGIDVVDEIQTGTGRRTYPDG